MTHRARTPGTARSTRRPSPSGMDSAWTRPTSTAAGRSEGDEELLTVAQQGRRLEPGLGQHPGGGRRRTGRRTRRRVGGRGVGGGGVGGHATDLAGEGEVAVLEPVAAGDLGQRALGHDPPAATTTMWSASRSASSNEWVVRTTAAPASASDRDQVPHVEPGVRVQARARLVEEGDLGTTHEGGRQGDAAAAGRRTAGAPGCRRTRRSPAAATSWSSGAGAAYIEARWRSSRTGGPRGQPSVLEHHADAGAVVGVGVPRVDAQDPHLPAVGAAQPLAALDHRRLARAVGPEHGRDLAGLGLPGGSVEGDHAAVALGEAGDGDGGWHAPSLGPRGGARLRRAGLGPAGPVAGLGRFPMSEGCLRARTVEVIARTHHRTKEQAMSLTAHPLHRPRRAAVEAGEPGRRQPRRPPHPPPCGLRASASTGTCPGRCGRPARHTAATRLRPPEGQLAADKAPAPCARPP